MLKFINRRIRGNLNNYFALNVIKIIKLMDGGVITAFEYEKDKKKI